MKIRIIIIFLLFLIYASCNNTKIIINRAIEELVSEFTSDHEEASNFYKGKFIQISGVVIYARQESVGLGFNSITHDNYFSYLKDNITINCEFDHMVFTHRFKTGENIIILGEYQDYTNREIFNVIRLKNCILISRETGENNQ